MKNLELKAEIIRRFGSQVAASRELGIGESKLSYIVSGHTEPSTRERKALEGVLGRSLANRLLGQNVCEDFQKRRQNDD